MKHTELIMGMPITIEIIDEGTKQQFNKLFAYFRRIDSRFSTYKSDSEIAKVNKGLVRTKWSEELKSVLDLCEQTRLDTTGFFNIIRDGKIDPSGLVKGWAINNASLLLIEQKIHNFYIEAGGDIQVHGYNRDKKPWTIGIRNPFNPDEIIKTIAVSSEGVATSGTYIRGQHIYNPFKPGEAIEDVKSLTVIGPNIYEADRYATAAFAMGERGIAFIESIAGLEGYMISSDKIATYTTGFEGYVVNA